ncbi:MAG: carbohydrate ABC transporter permease [Candidatus Promineifilaceae bacterium]
MLANPRLRLSYQSRLRLLLLPYLLGIILLVALPGIISFGLAFFHYNALSPPEWAGTLNFVLAYTDELFGLSVLNSLALIVLPVPMRVFGALLVARLLQRGGRWLRWQRAAVYLPSVIPTAAFALGWLWILNPLYGPVNLLLHSLGINPPHWFIDPQWVKPALVLMSLWQIGEGFLVSLAVLQDLPPELEDAAAVDGANRLQYFRHVLLPLVMPILLLLMFRDAILTFETSFAAVLIATQGGPYYSSYVLPMFIYEKGFDLLQFGVAGAALWALYLLSGALVIGLFLLGRQAKVRLTDETLIL